VFLAPWVGTQGMMELPQALARGAGRESPSLASEWVVSQKWAGRLGCQCLRADLEVGWWEALARARAWTRPMLPPLLCPPPNPLSIFVLSFLLAQLPGCHLK
jgi:hypothetical protein